MKDEMKSYLIKIEDRYGRFDEYVVYATSKAEAEAIANKPENVAGGWTVFGIETLPKGGWVV
jgi:hypothetical protein